MRFRVGSSVLILCFWTATFCSCNRQTELEGQWIGCEIRKPCVDIVSHGFVIDETWNFPYHLTFSQLDFFGSFRLPYP